MHDLGSHGTYPVVPCPCDSECSRCNADDVRASDAAFAARHQPSDSCPLAPLLALPQPSGSRVQSPALAGRTLPPLAARPLRPVARTTQQALPDGLAALLPSPLTT